MNKRVLLFIVLFLNASLVFGQDLKGVKVLINPGHGGHDPANDRHIVETDFWESEGNLSKGLYLREILLKLGATVYMSRTANEDADDLPLSDIVAMANQNNVEYMHSIHSNAAGGNYTLILYQGNDNAPTYPEAKAMSQYIGNEIFSAHRTTDLRLRGDFDFYGTGKPYLGVFRGLNMPGSLSEGSFHDYIPESWRLKNQAYLKHEAWAIAKAFLAYWRKPAFTTGIVAGIVRDPEQTSGYTVINPQDSYKPVNNIQITIKPLDASNTMAPRVCKGDSYNNGFFMFDELTPGSYKVYYEAAGYFKDSSTVTVQASKNTFADKNLVSTGLPEVVSVTSATGDSLYPGKQNIVIEFTRSMNMPSVEAAITTNPSAPLTFSWSGDKKVTVSTAGLPFNMNMTLTVAATAVESSHGLQLDGNRDGVAGDGYTYSFRTMIQDVISPVVTEVYPFDKQENVELIPYINVTFSEPLNTNTMSGKVKLLKTSTKTEVRTTQRYYKLDSGKAIIGIYPSAALQQNETYSVVVVAGLEDQFFNKVPSDIAYNFKTGNKPFSITPIDNFETGVTNWASPTANSSIGFVSSGTAVDANTYYRLIGSNRSMQISYSWDIDAASWLIRECLSGGTPQSVTFTSSNLLQAYIFGDGSNNKFRFCVADGSDFKGLEVSPWYTINWIGWRLLSWDMQREGTGTWDGNTSSNGILDGQLKFDSFQLSYAPGAQTSGSLYFEDLRFGTKQYTDAVEKEEGDEDLRPSNYSLAQNYPNPFNPSTTLSYKLPEKSFVSLKVFDLLGREVATLVNSEQGAGSYKVEFNASNIPSGIYLYMLRTDNFQETKKMVLLK